MRALFFISMIVFSFCFFAQAKASDTSTPSGPDGIAEGVEVQVFSNRLRAADEIIILETGGVYALDTVRGQIAELKDRGLDGRADSVRVLPQRFKMPSAMLLQDGQLYVADQEALWRVEADGDKTQIVPLTHAQPDGRFHLAQGDTPGQLIIGLTREKTATLINLDINSGVAALRGEAKGDLIALNRLPNGTLWTSVAPSPTTSRFSMEMKETESILKQVMSDFVVMPNDSPWGGELIAILDGTHVSRIPMTFGSPDLNARHVIQSGKTSDADQIRSLAADTRGVFVFNAQTRTLGIIQPAPSSASSSTVSPVSPSDKKLDP